MRQMALSILSPLSAICLMVMPSLSLGRQKSSTSLCCMIPLGEPWLPQTLICCLLMQIFWPLSITMCFSMELTLFWCCMLKHIVIEMGQKICINKQQIKVCGSQGSPKGIMQQREVELFCLPKDREGMTMRQMAESGDKIERASSYPTES